MADDVFHPHKLADAIPHPSADAEAPALNAMPEPGDPTAAEQQREAQESDQARNAQGDLRDRLVDIGKANHMAGRGNGPPPRFLIPGPRRVGRQSAGGRTSGPPLHGEGPSHLILRQALPSQTSIPSLVITRGVSTSCMPWS